MATPRHTDTISTRRRGGPAARRALALVLVVALVLASVSPAWAVTVEVESEAEGGAPPGALPGLEEGPEPEGEETALGEEAPLPGEEGEEEVPPEYEAPPEAPPPAPKAPAPDAPEVPAEPEAPPATPPATEPVYESAPGPEDQTEAPVPPVVHGETIVAPRSAPTRSHVRGNGEPSVPPSLSETPSSSTAPPAEVQPPAEAPPRTAPPRTAPPVERRAAVSVPAAEPAEPGALVGDRFHAVRPGESLWSIATALLRRGADDTEIAAKVHDLWRLNAARIGTGDPSLIFAGTRLRLA